MTIKLGLLLLGLTLIYGGWTNKSIPDILLGDNTVTKKSSNWPTTPGSSSASSSGGPSSSSSSGGGAYQTGSSGQPNTTVRGSHGILP